MQFVEGDVGDQIERLSGWLRVSGKYTWLSAGLDLLSVDDNLARSHDVKLFPVVCVFALVDVDI